MECTIRWVPDTGMAMVAETGSGHLLAMDGAPDGGGRNLAPRPMETLLAGAGGCTAYDVVLILKRGRHVLGTSSGFQSAQFREIEYRLGLKDPAYLQHYAEGSSERANLQDALETASLREAAIAALERSGFDVGDRSPEALAAAWLQVYRDAERWFELYELAEKLVDIDDALAAWRHKHVLTVERIIGNKRGTGGSEGASYLRSTLDKRIFPELWSLRTEL